MISFANLRKAVMKTYGRTQLFYKAKKPTIYIGIGIACGVGAIVTACVCITVPSKSTTASAVQSNFFFMYVLTCLSAVCYPESSALSGIICIFEIIIRSCLQFWGMESRHGYCPFLSDT